MYNCWSVLENAIQMLNVQVCNEQTLLGLRSSMKLLYNIIKDYVRVTRKIIIKEIKSASWMKQKRREDVWFEGMGHKLGLLFVGKLLAFLSQLVNLHHVLQTWMTLIRFSFFPISHEVAFPFLLIFKSLYTQVF